MGNYYIGGFIYNQRQLSIVSVTSILVILSTAAVALRVYARLLIGRRLYPDDICIIIALVLSYGNCICEYVGLVYGLGRHAAEVGEPRALRYLLVLYVMQMFWNTTLPVIKVSILLFYRRLFPTQRIHQITMGLFIFLGVWYTAFQLAAIFQCTPVNYYWNRTIPGHCVNYIDLYIALAATNTLTDITLLVLPMPTVWGLKVSRSRKLALSGVFLLGAFVCGISLYRISTLPLIDPNDITWSNTFAGVWTAIEGSVGVIVACLPSLMPIWRRLRGHAADHEYYSSQANRYGGSKGLQAGVSRSRATRQGFETITTATSLERNNSEERIIQNSTVVAYANDTDIKAAQGEITVVTKVQQDIELRRLP